MLWIDRQRTSSVRVRYESGELPSPGALCNTETNVLPDPCKDVVKIEKVKYYYDTPLRQGGWSLRTELDTVETLTFEEFKQSKWWETYLQRVSKHNCDSSWMDYCNTLVDENGCIAQFKIPEYKSVWWCSSDIPSGNVITCEVCVSYDGTVCVLLWTSSQRSLKFPRLSRS